MTEELLPNIKVSQTVVYGIAIAAGVLVLFLYYENQKMRKELNQAYGKKPCNCNETTTVPSYPAYVPPPRVTTNVQPDSSAMVFQDSTAVDPENPPTIIVD